MSFITYSQGTVLRGILRALCAYVIQTLKRLTNTVAQLKGKLAKSVETCTHLVTDKVHRTVKLLSAIGTLLARSFVSASTTACGALAIGWP